MKCLEQPLLADENVHPGVVAELRAKGIDVLHAAGSLLQGADDVDVMRSAFKEGRVVVTHDADFGALAVRMSEPIVGIVYLRPGHIRPAFVLAMLEALAEVEVEPPFIVVAERSDADLRVRVRSLLAQRAR